MGHFSRFIPVGSLRVDSSQGLLLTSVAFLTPKNKVIVVVQNTHDFLIDFKLQDGSFFVKVTIPARAMQTFEYDNHLF
jgi:glucosylceramidase